MNEKLLNEEDARDESNWDVPSSMWIKRGIPLKRLE